MFLVPSFDFVREIQLAARGAGFQAWYQVEGRVTAMSYAHTAILGAIAFSATFGAVQFAAGRDLTSGLRVFSSNWESGVNRAAKADRIGAVTAPAMRTRTVSVQLQSLANTSVLIRLPQRQEARDTDSGKRPVACEPVVSVLTEIAKRLQPGRCIT